MNCCPVYACQEKLCQHPQPQPGAGKRSIHTWPKAANASRPRQPSDSSSLRSVTRWRVMVRVERSSDPRPPGLKGCAGTAGLRRARKTPPGPQGSTGPSALSRALSIEPGPQGWAGLSALSRAPRAELAPPGSAGQRGQRGALVPPRGRWRSRAAGRARAAPGPLSGSLFRALLAQRGDASRLGLGAACGESCGDSTSPNRRIVIYFYFLFGVCLSCCWFVYLTRGTRLGGMLLLAAAPPHRGSFGRRRFGAARGAWSAAGRAQDVSFRVIGCNISFNIVPEIGNCF